MITDHLIARQDTARPAADSKPSPDGGSGPFRRRRLPSYYRWDRSDRAIRRYASLPPSRLTAVVAYGIGFVSVAAAVLIVINTGL